MAAEAIGTYLHLLFRDGSSTGYAFQNFAAGRTVSYLGTNYLAAGYGFSGSSFDASSSSISASIVFGLNQLDFNIFEQASRSRWLAEVRTTWLNPETFDPELDWTLDVYEVLGISHDNSRLSVRLGSPLDAISEQVPRLRLTQSMVGSLPSKGNIPFS
jgi:hypothetical protein